MTAYRGFHPHLLRSTYYAHIREENNWMIELREKGAFSNLYRREKRSLLQRRSKSFYH